MSPSGCPSRAFICFICAFLRTARMHHSDILRCLPHHSRIFSGRLLLLQRRHHTDMITYSHVDTQTIRTFFHMRNLTHTSFPDLVAARGFAAMRGPVNTFILPGPVALPYLVARSSLSALSPHNPHSIPCPDNARIPNGAYPQCTHSTCRKCGLGERLTV